MFERFTRDARKVVEVAEREVRELGRGVLGTEHLLLGVACGDGPAGAVLESAGATPERLRADLASSTPAAALGVLGIDFEQVRRHAEATFGQGALERGRQRSGGRPAFTPPAKMALELALREALDLGDKAIGAEHILLGILLTGDPAAILPLKRSGADPLAVRTTLLASLEAQPPRFRGN